MNGPSMRSLFCEYAAKELVHLRTFLAENAEKDYVTHDEPEFHNIAEFEEIIAHVSDCLIIFPESPGSFAELGYFSKNEELTKKILVAHRADMQGDDSFMLRGPIKLIDKNSQFEPTVQLNYGPAPDFGPIKQRIEKRITGKKRQKFKFESFAKLDFRQTFFAIFEIIRLFEVLTLDAIIFAFRSIFTNVNSSHVKQLLSILVAADLVRRKGDDPQLFCINRSSKSFMEFDGFDTDAFHLELVDFYNEHFPDLAKAVGELANDH